MIQQKIRRTAVLFLAALSFALSACGTGDGSDDAVPTESGTVSPSQQVETPPATESAVPSYSTEPTEPASPSQSPTPEPSQDETPAPTHPETPPVETPGPSQSTPPTSEVPPPSQGVIPAGAVAEGEDVGNDWFADAVFLGDSRTDGLRLYSGIKGASFICHTGLSVFTVGKNACIKSDGGKITAMDALGLQQYAKVYLMLGVNELGYSTASFKKTYTEVVEQIKQLQPGAAIYLQTLIPINEPIAYKNGTNRAINNEKLKEFNLAISDIAQAEQAYLVDVDTPFWSADGCLAAENTGDGVHLTRAGYQAWFAYLRTHTGNAGTGFAPSGEGWTVPEYTSSPEIGAPADQPPA